MKREIRYVIILVVIFIIMSIPNIVKAGTTENGLKYEIQEDGVHIIGYDESIKQEIEIPSQIEGKTVTTIDEYAFGGRTNLTDITIPNSVTSIGDGAFMECIDLTNITIPNSVTSIEDGVFCGCTSLTNITIPNSVTSIGKSAFYRCSLTNITIPNSVTSIKDNTFDECTSLTNITIPNSVTSIGNYTFDGCTSLTNITIPNSVTSIGKSAFYRCTSLTNITIPNSVTSIGEGAFWECISLTNIAIPNNVTCIRGITFYDCTSLTNITIPNSVTSIGEGAFMDCIGLTNITIPNNITSIGNYAFSDCTNLTSITIPNSVTSIGKNAFFNCTNLTLYVYKNSYAEEYAIANNLNYEYINEGEFNFIHFKHCIINNKNCLINFDLTNNTVDNIINAEKENLGDYYTLKFYKGNNEITGDSKVGTGTVVKIMHDNEIQQEYIALLYGDTTGNGNPSAVDALTVVKNKLGTAKFLNEIYEEAGRVTDTTRLYKGIPSAVDALSIVKYKLNIGTINQYMMPNISVQKDGEYLIINVKDENVITLVEYTLNEQQYRINLTARDADYYNEIEGLSVKTNVNNDIVEMEYRQLIDEKETNTINLTATNKKGVKTTFSNTFTSDYEKPEYEGFSMVGTIEISKISLKQPILEKVSTKALDTSVCLLYGNLNKVGNSVIIGQNDKFFSNLYKLANGDTIKIKDYTGKEITYTIYSIFETEPEDTSFYQRNTNGAREVTLSTTTDDNNMRLIVCAKET